MIHRFLVLGLLLLVAGCCRPCNRCCQRTCQPCQQSPLPPPPPPSEPPPGGDTGCATWNNPECPNGMSRPAMLNAIKVNAEAAFAQNPQTITESQLDLVLQHYNKYMQ